MYCLAGGFMKVQNCNWTVNGLRVFTIVVAHADLGFKVVSFFSNVLFDL